MNIYKNGKLLRDLRKTKSMTQKQLAQKIGVVPKTVSKWETGNGMPDISAIPKLAKILETSEGALLSSDTVYNAEQVSNAKKVKFYVCPHCSSFTQSMGESDILCCGKKLAPLKVNNDDGGHGINLKDDGNEIVITFNHEMTKEHFIKFAAYVSYDRILTIQLYPEQDNTIRIAKTHGGQLYYYCTKHGLFLHKSNSGKNNNKNGAASSLTALMSAYARAYCFKNAKSPIFKDEFAQCLFTDDEYNKITNYIIKDGNKTSDYVYKYLAPTPLARAKFCEEALNSAVKTGTTQYVILASGYDTYSLRSNKNIKVFETDKKSTLDDKIMRIRRAGLKIPNNCVFADVDLSRDNLEEKLIQNGFDKTQKTFFSCLGLMYYLSKDEIENLFKAIADFAPDGSSIAFDFADGHLFSSPCERTQYMLKAAQLSGEPMKSCFSYPELEKMLEKNSLLIYEFLNDKDIQNKYFLNNNELCAFSNINFVLAVIKK